MFNANKQKQKISRDIIEKRVRALEDMGFKAGLSQEPPREFPGADTVVTLSLRDRKEYRIGGSAGYQLEKLRELFEEKVIRHDNMPGNGRVCNYDIEALMELMAFIMGFRKQGTEMEILVTDKEMEITCSPSEDRDGSIAGWFMRGTLLDNIQKLAENGNEYSLPGYNLFEDELFIRVPCHRYFIKPEAICDAVKIAGMREGAILTKEEAEEFARRRFKKL